MKKKFSFPFQNLSPEAWQNLALIATFGFYISFFGFFLINTEICKDYTIDYCAFYSAGRIINEKEFADIYDLNILSKYQEIIYQRGHTASHIFYPFEILYLPIFILPFKFLSLLKIIPSYLIWISINLIGFVLYLRFFVKKMQRNKLPFKIGLMMTLSLPVFINFYEGQLNIWLVICVGEFMRTYLSNKPFKAGLWLGGWLLKPQLLILIIPFLLLKRSVKAIVGFALSTLAILTLSFSFIKTNGFVNLAKVIMKSAGGGGASNASAMINWRMLGWHISSLTAESLGTIIVIIGSLITTFATFVLFRKAYRDGAAKPVVAILGIFTTTLAVTWHAHLHMAVILIPPMVYLLMENRFNKKLFLAYVFIPVIVQILTFLFLAAENLGVIPEVILPIGKLAPGLTGFILNILILRWTIVDGCLNEFR